MNEMIVGALIAGGAYLLMKEKDAAPVAVVEPDPVPVTPPLPIGPGVTVDAITNMSVSMSVGNWFAFSWDDNPAATRYDFELRRTDSPNGPPWVSYVYVPSDMNDTMRTSTTPVLTPGVSYTWSVKATVNRQVGQWYSSIFMAS